jgi:hypothetical protein
MNDFWKNIISDSFSGIIVAIGTVGAAAIAAILTVRKSLKKFYSQKWWEKKAELYSCISEDLSNLFFCIKELCSESEGEKNLDSHRRDTLGNEYRRCLDSLKKTSAGGSYIISKEVSEELEILINKLENNYHNPQKESIADYYGRDYKAIETCNKNFNKFARKDLNIQD